MTWVWICVGIAVVGLGMLVAYAVWLAHKAADVMSEVRVLSDRAAQFGALLEQIELLQHDLRHNDRIVEGEVYESRPT